MNKSSVLTGHITLTQKMVVMLATKEAVSKETASFCLFLAVLSGGTHTFENFHIFSLVNELMYK